MMIIKDNAKADSLKAYMGQFPQDGENGQNVAFFILLKPYCD